VSRTRIVRKGQIAKHCSLSGIGKMAVEPTNT
jgi:hypothetical protein